MFNKTSNVIQVVHDNDVDPVNNRTSLLFGNVSFLDSVSGFTSLGTGRTLRKSNGLVNSSK